jgi:hypothetical protein
MTRRKDKIKKKQECLRIQQNLSKSRLHNQEQEISKQINLLEKIQKLPHELIRIIYNYMSNNAKLFCNFKLDYIEKKMKSYELYCNLNSIRNLSKKEFLDFINKGILCKFPDIIESIDDYYYCLDVNKFTKVIGQHLFNLWEENKLVIDINNENYSSEEEKVFHIDWSIKYCTKDSIMEYIKKVIELYNIQKSRTISQKNWIFNDNTLFWKIDNVFYLYKCIENLICRKNKNKL